MKIDFDMLETMVASGATGGSILAAWKAHEAKKVPKRTKEAARIKTKRTNTKQHKATESNIEQHTATSANIPTPQPADASRARIFALRPRLVALGLEPDRAGSVLGQWCKITRDNAAAIETAVAGAELKRPADPIGYIRAVLQDRSSINGDRHRTVSTAADDLIARAESFERENDLGAIDVEFSRVESR